jgi:anion transporter
MATLVERPVRRVYVHPALHRVGILAGIGVPILLWFLPLGISASARHALAIAAFAVIFWIVQPIEHAWTGLIACFLFMALKVAPPNLAFSGFASDAPWFLFGAILIGAAAAQSGLAGRLAHRILGIVGTSYSRILLGFILVDFTLIFLVPSGIARVTILASMAIGVVEAFAEKRGSNIGRGIFILLTYTATIFDKMILGGAASIAARGVIETFGHVQVYWGHWFLAFLPCDLVTILACWWLIPRLYPPERTSLAGARNYLREHVAALGPMTALERRAAFWIGLAIVLWVTDFLHHVRPSVIGLGVGLALALPRVGVLTIEDVKKVNWLPMFFVAASLTIGQVLQETRALDLLTRALFSWLDPLVTGGSFATSTFFYWFAFLYHIIAGDEVSMLSTSIPPLMQYAIARGLNPLTLGMLCTFAAGGKLFVYESATLIVGYSYGYFDSRDMLRVGFLLTIIESLVLLYVVPFYWPLIGLRLR